MEINIGKLVTFDEARLQNHLSLVDKQLIQEYNKHGFSIRYEDLLKSRGFSYTEYLSLFDKDIKKHEFNKHLIYQYLKIEVEHAYTTENERIIGRTDFTNKYEANKMGYFKLLDDIGFSLAKYKANAKAKALKARISYKRMWEHMYINGASGCGKSTLIKRILYILSKRKVGIVLIDPQGKLASEVADFKHLDKEKIVLFKPTLRKGFSPVLNILQKDRGNDTNNMALRLARVLSIISKGELSNPMVSLLRPCLAVLLENEGYSLPDLKRFLLKDENEDLVQLGLNHPDPEYQSTFKRINSGYYNKTRDAILSKLDVILQDQAFRNLTTGESTINLKSCIKQGKIIIFDLGGLDTDTIQAFGRLVVALILHIALERDAKKMRKYKRTFLFIDEMQNFLSPDLIKILDEARQKKLHLVMAHQRIGQLKSHVKTNLEEGFVDSMMGNTAIKIVGHNDSPDTINILSSKLGMDKQKLIGIPNYEFLLRVRGKRDVHFKSSNAINSKRMYRNKRESKVLEEYMLQQYYKPVSVYTGMGSGIRRDAIEDKEKVNEENNVENKQVDLEEDDF